MKNHSLSDVSNSSNIETKLDDDGDPTYSRYLSWPHQNFLSGPSLIPAHFTQCNQIDLFYLCHPHLSTSHTHSFPEAAFQPEFCLVRSCLFPDLAPSEPPNLVLELRWALGSLLPGFLSLCSGLLLTFGLRILSLVDLDLFICCPATYLLTLLLLLPALSAAVITCVSSPSQVVPALMPHCSISKPYSLKNTPPYT